MIYGEDEENQKENYVIIEKSESEHEEDINNNLYVYCMSNPLKLIDPFGNYCYEEFGSIKEAIQDWAWNNCGYTRATGIEKGATLFAAYNDNGELYYSYTWTEVGSYGEVDVISTMSDMPQGAIFQGYIHSHYTYDYISYIDKRIAREKNTSIYMVYVENGTGFVNRYGKDRRDIYTETYYCTIYGYDSWRQW